MSTTQLHTTITSSTRIGFPRGETSGHGVVEFAKRGDDGRVLIVCDSTPAHPVSFRWPDQQADIGTVSWGNGQHQLIDAWTGLVDRRTGELWTGDAAKALGRTDENWVRVVVHVLETPSDIPSLGTRITIEINRQLRQQLSAVHTAAHLSAFALNRTLARYWSKNVVVLDSLGSPDFDKEALITSKIDVGGCTDTYRLGKTLRRKGFDGAAAMVELPLIAGGVNAVLASWLRDPAPVILEPADSTLDTRRIWRCLLGGRVAQMFCAGTHVDHLSALETVEVSLSGTNDGLTMQTVAKQVDRHSMEVGS